MMLKLYRSCEELCRRRIELEIALGLEPTCFEKCVKICRAFKNEGEGEEG